MINKEKIARLWIAFFLGFYLFGTVMPVAASENREEVLTLKECIYFAKNRNDLLNSVEGEVRSAAARVDAAAAGTKPHISVQGNYGTYTEEHRLAQATYDGERGSYDDQLGRVDLTLSVPLYTGGRVENEIATVRNRHQMQQSLYSRSEQELEYQVSRMYFSILARNKIISSLRASRKTLESHYARIKNRVSAGKAPSIDLTRMSVELGSIEQEILKAEGELKLMYLELAYMTGIPYDEKPFTLEDRMEIKEPEREMEMLVSQALEKRPDLMAADYFLQAGEHGIKAAESLSKPQVSLKSSVTYLRNPDGEDDTSGYIGLNVEFPLWDGGLARARMKEAQGERDTAFYKKKDLISRIRLEVESACTELATTFKRVQVTEEALENAREGLRIEMLKHEMNKGTVTDVLQAQSALLAAESDLTLALAENNIAEARLRLTIGVDRS